MGFVTTASGTTFDLPDDIWKHCATLVNCMDDCDDNGEVSSVVPIPSSFATIDTLTALREFGQNEVHESVNEMYCCEDPPKGHCVFFGQFTVQFILELLALANFLQYDHLWNAGARYLGQKISKMSKEQLCEYLNVSTPLSDADRARVLEHNPYLV